MAVLKSGTTVDGQSVIHAGNIGAHGILSTSSAISGSLTIADASDNNRLYKGGNFINPKDPWGNYHIHGGATGSMYFDSASYNIRNAGQSVTWLYIDGGQAKFRTYAGDTNYNIRITGGDQFNAYYGDNATTMYINWNGGETRFGSTIRTNGYLYTNYEIRVGEIWGHAGLYRSSGHMMFGTEGGHWYFQSSNNTRAQISQSDGNIWMSWANDWLSNLLNARQPVENQRLSTGDSPTFVNVYASDWFRTYNTAGLYSQTHGIHFYPSSSQQWNFATQGHIYLTLRTGHESTVRGYVHANTSNEIGFLSEDGNWVLKTWNRGVEAYGSMRAPIFYDSDNTNYYGNFASTSRFNRLLVQQPDSNSAAGPALRVSKGYDNLVGDIGYDTLVVESNDVTTIRMKEADGGTAGWTAGDGYTTYTSTNPMRFYTNGSATSYVYNGMGGGLALYLDNSQRVGINTSAPTARLHVRNTVQTSEAFAVDGVNGRLFTVTDDLSGSLFSVNTIAGLPLIEAFADNVVKIGKYGSNAIYVGSDGRIGINTTDFSYTTGDNSPVVGAGHTANKLYVNGSIQLLSNDDAIVIGRGTATFLKDEELGFGWGGGWYMVESAYIRSRGGKSLHMNGGSVDYLGSMYLEGSGTSAHLQPNAGSYGSLQVTGSKNSWHGIRFTGSDVNLMVNTNESGFHNNNYGWQFRWENGTLYVHKNSYGGGTVATVLDTSNYSNWAQPASGAINTGNIGSQKVDGALKLWAASHPNDYYIVNNWTGSYWQLTTNHGNGVQVAYANDAANADTTDGLHVHGGRNNEANKIVRTDGNGYAQFGWINTDSGVTTSTPARFYGSDDGYLRYYTRDYMKMFLGGTFKYVTSRKEHIDDSSYWTGVMGWGTTDWNDMFHWGSGFLDSWNSPANQPPSGDGHHTGLQVLHYTNGTYAYGWQMVQAPSSNEIWHRGRWGTSFSTWRKLIDSANIGSQSVSYASTAGSAPANGGNADTVDGWHRDDLRAWGNLTGVPSTFPPSSHNHDGTYLPIGGTAANADRLYPFGAAIDDTHPGYGLRAWYDWSYSGTYRNGLTLGSHPSDQSYGWQIYQNMWDDRTYTRRYNGGWQSTRTLLTAQDDLYAYNMNQYVRTSDAVTFANVYNAGWFRNYGNQGIYNQDYGTHFYSNGGSTWAITGSGGAIELQFRSNHQSTMRGYVYANTSNEIGFLSEDGNWVLRTWNRGVEAYGSMRAPIYYDSNNTDYYLDPASTSRLGDINSNYFRSYGNARVDNRLYLDQQYGSTLVGVYSSYRFQGIWTMGDSWHQAIDGTNLGNLYGLSWSHPNAGGEAGYLSDHGLLVVVNGNAYAAISSDIWARRHIKAGDNIYVGAAGGWITDLLAGKASISHNHTYNQITDAPTKLSAFTNDVGYITSDGRAYPKRTDGSPLDFRWDGQGGQPTWLWGSNDGNNIYVWNPSNFSVNYANSAGSASSATSATVATNVDNGNTYTTGNNLYIKNSGVNNYRVHHNGGIGVFDVTAEFSIREMSSIWSATRYVWGNYMSYAWFDVDPWGDNWGIGSYPDRWKTVNRGSFLTFGIDDYSDRRSKSAIIEIDNAVDKVKAISGYTYWKVGSEVREAGVIAQDVLAVFPEATGGTEDGYSVKPSALIGLLMKAVKEQQEIIDNLTVRIEQLENR